MNRQIVRALVVFLLIAVFGVARALAILGVGDIVFDPANFEEAVQQLIQMAQQYEQLVRTNAILRNQYEHMLRMAQRVPVDMVSRYRAPATPWGTSTASDTYGTTGGWVAGVNTGAGVSPGYAQAVLRLKEYGAALASVPADQMERLRKSYATVELSDGANVHAMETVGRLRAAAPSVERAIQGLEVDSLSALPEMNTEIAVLNKVNAASLITVRSQQDANKLLVTLAEAQLVQAKRIRDAEAEAINNHIRFKAEGKAVMTGQASGSSSAMTAWRMP